MKTDFCRLSNLAGCAPPWRYHADVLNRRFGRDSVRVGSATLASHDADVRSWATKQERRSPRFTTCWDEMPVVKA